MLTLTVRVDRERTIPVPTISQGLAIFPREAGTIMELIDLADRRLYVAKERGRNQIEPQPTQQAMLILEEQNQETRL